MNLVDLIIGLLLGFGFLKGFAKGLVIELSSLVALFLGFLGAIKLSNFITEQIEGFFNLNPLVIQIISFLVVFIVIVYSISLLAKGVTKILSQASLGLFNKFLGSIFGTLKWAIISSVILFFASKINQWITIMDQELINKSFLYAPIIELGEYLFNWGSVIKDEFPNDLI